MIHPFLFAIFVSNFAMAESKIHIVANRSLKIEEIKGSSKIKNIFLKRKRFLLDGVKIHPVDRVVNSADRILFNKIILQRTELELAEFWIQQRQINGTTPPIRISEQETLLDVIENTDGSIGYLLIDEKQLEVINSKRKILIFSLDEKI